MFCLGYRIVDISGTVLCVFVLFWFFFFCLVFRSSYFGFRRELFVVVRCPPLVCLGDFVGLVSPVWEAPYVELLGVGSQFQRASGSWNNPE